ncbi:MAG: hypothetical protein R3211_05965, partial [Balneolaceae bacterium]|nr:hypothetical protein [Balneolaceae bacterium]
DQDTVEVPLDDNWVQDYRNFFIREDAQRDSVYRVDFHGLAIVPRNNAKILGFERGGTEFIIENVLADTLSQGLNDWAYSLQRTNVPAAPAGTDILHSTLENIVQFDMDLTRENLGTVNISKVELVISQDRETLANTIGQVSTSAVRPPLNGINLSLADPRDVPIVLSSSFALSSDSLTADDEVLRFNITTFTNSVLLSGVPEQQRFYLSLQPANGLIRSSLIYNSNAPAGKKPKLIITSIQSE